MPFDDYECPKCGTIIQKCRPITETAPPFIPCENCRKKGGKILPFMKKKLPVGISVKYNCDMPTPKRN